MSFNPLKNKHFQVKLTEDDENSAPVVEEGITLTKSDILTAVVVLTLVNGVCAMGLAKIVKDN